MQLIMSEEEIDVDEMRYELAEQSAMNMIGSQIVEILLDGVQGLNEIPDIEIKDKWNQIFGEDK